MSDINVLTILNQVIHKVEKGKDFPEITREMKFSSLGISSIVIFEIIGEIEDELDITIPENCLTNIQTVGDVEKIVLTQLNKRVTSTWWQR